MKSIFSLTLSILLFSLAADCQNLQKVPFDTSDSTNGYYLAMPPASGNIRAVLVLFCPFRGPETMLAETRLHSVAAAGDLLTIYASTGNKITPDQIAIERMNRLFTHVLLQYKADSSFFAVGGFDLSGMIALRYTELAWEHPGEYAVHPKVIFGIASAVDLAGFYHICERQIKKNVFPPGVNDAKFFMGLLDKGPGSPEAHPEQYASLSPFLNTQTGPGNEQFLRHVAVRLYYDTDVEWQLKFRRNSYYDTYLPDGAELINRLLLQGNNKAEFISSRQPGMRSNGNRNPTALSIVDETDCIQWIKKELHVFSPSNPMAFSGPYSFGVPDRWRIERSSFPPPFAPKVKLTGVEEIRFPPGWGVAGSEDYWSVAYLLWLDAGQKIDEAVLQENLKIYYDGLVITGGGPVPHNIPKDKLVPTRVHIQKIKAEPDDVDTYSGTIDMLDYMAMKPMTLNYMVHVKSCNDKGHFPVFLELSPKPFTDVIWHDLKRMKKDFTCE
ncbi:MAG TPA: hypothetical protein VL832_29290 [Puia sp.]|nr:hypothetical protein [Puia sp.]